MTIFERQFLLILFLSLVGIGSFLYRYLYGYQWESLEYIYETYQDDFGFHKWGEYASHYDTHIQHIRDDAIKNWTTVNILEIGVQSGGSTRAWRRYFGPLTRYVGIDINPNCKQVESENIHIEIGSQLDPFFLMDICLKYGPFDLIIDDGGHTTEMIIVSLEVLWNCLNHRGVYIIEDTHSMSMWKQAHMEPEMIVDGKDIFGHLADFSRNMIVYFREKEGTMMRRDAWMDDFSKHISQIAVYDSLVFLHYNQFPKMLSHLKKGKIWISDKF